MQKLYYKSYFKQLTREQIREWLEVYKGYLVGSAVFTRSNNLVGKVVSCAEWFKCPNKKGFIPSHTGSIVERDGELLIFDMKPLKATTQSLERYLWLTKEDFVIVLRDFELDRDMFSRTILEHEGQGYPYLSAIRSVFTKRQTKWKCHCSELHLRKLQMQGVLTELNAEITPDELLHEMLKG